jgi:hypothetical protein
MYAFPEFILNRYHNGVHIFKNLVPKFGILDKMGPVLISHPKYEIINSQIPNIKDNSKELLSIHIN